jgi:hypothetical protein
MGIVWDFGFLIIDLEPPLKSGCSTFPVRIDFLRTYFSIERIISVFQVHLIVIFTFLRRNYPV